MKEEDQEEGASSSSLVLLLGGNNKIVNDPKTASRTTTETLKDLPFQSVPATLWSSFPVYQMNATLVAQPETAAPSPSLSVGRPSETSPFMQAKHS